MKVLTIGATGQYAGLVVPELKKRGATVRALVRDEGRVGAALLAGADETAVGNLRDPASLRAAAEGVEGVFHINPAFAPGEAEMGVAMFMQNLDGAWGSVVESGWFTMPYSKWSKVCYVDYRDVAEVVALASRCPRDRCATAWRG